MEYVQGKKQTVPRCLFEPPGGTRHNREHLMLYRDNQCVVLLNGFPYAHGHLLVAPRRHVACLTELQTGEAVALMEMVRISARILKENLSCDGLNIGCNIGEAAGAGIADHLHFHLVPRWSGDHNYMAVIADIRTIPEHIQNTYDTFVVEFDKLEIKP